MRSPNPHDWILVGAGLQNGLLALALLERDPRARIVLVDRGGALGGNHTWCFHSNDLPEAARSFVEPLVEHRWPGYEVRFPGRSRRLDSPYACITSARFAEVLGRRLENAEGARVLLGANAARVEARRVTLDDGRVLEGSMVVDSRGPLPDSHRGSCGYQKFFGLELALDRPHGLERPILMDATVLQLGGFRFLYTLPLGPDRVLVEDTYFSRTPDLDRDASRRWLLSRVASEGHEVTRVLREESGVLPMPWQGDPVEPRESPLVAGYAGGWFHPATGYSFPVALRLALAVASSEPAEVFGPTLRRLFEEHRTQVRFAHFLNRMLFQLFEPAKTWNVFDRFYRLPESVIERFYSLRLTTADRARMLMGRPPRGISMRAAMQALRSAP